MVSARYCTVTDVKTNECVYQLIHYITIVHHVKEIEVLAASHSMQCFTVICQLSKDRLIA